MRWFGQDSSGFIKLTRKGHFQPIYAYLVMALSALIGLSACASAGTSQSASSIARSEFIPRSELFADVTYSAVSLSPDGTQVAYMKPSNGARNIWVGPSNDFDAAVPVTSFERAPRSFSWHPDGRFILIVEDWVAREMKQLWSLNLESGVIKNLTNDPTVVAKVIKTSKVYPSKALVGINGRDARFHDVFMLNLVTGERQEVFRNDGRFIDFRADADLNVNVGVRGNDDGSSTYVHLGGEKRTELMTIPLDALRSTKVMSFSDEGIFTMLDSVDSEFANLVKLDTTTGKRTIVAEALEADINAVFNDKKSNTLWATREDPLSPKWTVRSPAAIEEFAALEELFGDRFSIVGQPDETRLLILQSFNDKPARYHWWNRTTKTAKLIISTQPNLEKYTLAKRRPVMIPTRDGLSLPSYLTLPPGTPVNANGFPTQAIPLVVTIHGGPWLRVTGDFSPRTAVVDYWLADRGYVSLAMNFRGSVGFGKSFTSAGDKQWAGDMHNDVIDSIDWAINNGITVRDKVASYGLSYGGYASMVSLAFTPNRFQCAVAINGPANLVRQLSDMPAWWRYQWPQWIHRVGNPYDAEGAIDLMNRSPISRVADIKGPLLIMATGKDPRVLERHAESMVSAMEALDKPVTYFLYEDEGHAVYRAEVTISMRAIQEHFLADCLGNSAEPFGTDLEHSDVEVKSGVDLVSGLPEALQATGTKRFSRPHIVGE